MFVRASLRVGVEVKYGEISGIRCSRRGAIAKKQHIAGVKSHIASVDERDPRVHADSGANRFGQERFKKGILLICKGVLLICAPLRSCAGAS